MPRKALRCSRCKLPLDFKGTKDLNGGGAIGSFISSVFASRSAVDIYVCKSCGHIELFDSEVGAEARGRT